MVEPETFTFLTDLANNNKKKWLDDHRPERDDAMRNFTGIAITLHDYADRFDPFVAQTRSKPKQSFSKFFQDARDRRGPGLYRTDVDVFANAGHPSDSFGYYINISPGNCHAGAGLFQPDKFVVARMQSRIADDPSGFKDILTDTEFKTHFTSGIITRNLLGDLPSGLKGTKFTTPYLKMIGLGCRKDLSDADLGDDDVMDQLIEIFRASSQLVRFFE